MDTTLTAQPHGLPRNEDGSLPSFAWPGGYPLYYLTRQGNVVCPDCANDPDVSEDDAPEACDANWEDPDLYCDGCGERIESAYADDEPADEQPDADPNAGEEDEDLDLAEGWIGPCAATPNRPCAGQRS